MAIPKSLTCKLFRFDEAINCFNQTLQLYEERYLANLSYHVFNITNYERIYLVEDVFVLYAGIIDGPSNDGIYTSEMASCTQLSSLYHFYFEELLFNELFDFSMYRFRKEIQEKIGLNIVEYEKFDSSDLRYKREKEYFKNSLVYRINKTLPDLFLFDRFDNWKGIPIYHIVYEFHYDHKIGYAFFSTTQKNPYSLAKRKEKDLEYSLLRILFSKHQPDFDDFMQGDGSLQINRTFLKQFEKLVDSNKKTKWENSTKINGKTIMLNENLFYYVIPGFTKNISSNSFGNGISYRTLISEIENKKYEYIEKIRFNATNYRWVSEFLCLEIVKKLFPKNNVIHQYRPYFLHTPRGQMSLDVYVCNKKIAIEYQGKQHFEPVDIFGGEEGYKKTKERDLIKKELCDSAGVTLVYITYLDDITPELIKDRINKQLMLPIN